MRASLLALLIVIGLGAGPGATLALAQPQLTVTDAPDVVVANEDAWEYDEETGRQSFTGDYVFAVSAQIHNDEDQRNVQAEAIIYTDQDVDEGCPSGPGDRAFPTQLVAKRFNLSSGETVRYGGEASAENAEQQEYWPHWVSTEYQDRRTGDHIQLEEGTHRFCVTLRATGQDPACDRPADQTCVIATAPYESYVRLENAPPHVTSMSVSPDNPDVGQRALLQAEAIDNSTQPREDPLTYTWRVDGDVLSGPNVQHSFGSEGVHEVTVEVTDGFDTTERTLRVPVGNATVDDGGDRTDSPSAGLAVGLVLIAVVASLARRRR